MSHMATHTAALLGCTPCVGRRRTRSSGHGAWLCRPSCSTASGGSLGALSGSQPVAVTSSPRATRPGRRGPTTVAVASSAEGVGIGDLMQHLLSNRIIFVGRVVTDVVAQQVCSALMALELEDPRKDIKMYLNTGGGQQYSVMAVIDMMNQVKCDVQTVALGNVASTATLILANGTKGKRYAMKNSRIMVNQPLGGVQGSFVDVRLQAAEQSRNIKVAREILHLASGKSRDDVGELLDREFFMSPEEAQQFGIIDAVL